MLKILNAGRYIFPLSYLMYIGLHLGKPDTGSAFVPDFIPYPLFWNYLTALFILLFVVSALMKRYDGLAYIFRNIMVTGALMAFAKFVAKDKRVISSAKPI